MEKRNVRGSFGTFWLGPKYEEIQERAVDGPAAGVVPPARDAIPVLTVDMALGIGAVYRCVSIISAAISQMELGVFRNGVEIDTPTLIRQPNIDRSQRQFIKDTVYSLATHGNAYWRVYGTYPNIQNLQVLDPASVTAMEDPETGKVTYWVGPNEVKNIKHLRLMSKPGHIKGFGPIQMGQAELTGALRVRRFADEWFGGAGIPTGMLTTDQKLNAEEAKAYADAFNEFIKQNGTAVLSQGMRYDYLNIKPADAQFLEIQQAHTVSIARLFGVPATLLASGNEGASNTYTNQQELFMQFLTTTLIDYMNEIEDALSSLLPRGQRVSFKEEQLLRMNTEAETAVEVARIQSGMTTANEWRAKHGLPPIKEVEPNEDV